MKSIANYPLEIAGKPVIGWREVSAITLNEDGRNGITFWLTLTTSDHEEHSYQRFLALEDDPEDVA